MQLIKSGPVDRSGASYSVMELVDLENFLATKNLSRTCFKKLDIIWRKVLRRFRWLLAQLAYHRGSSEGVSFCACMASQSIVSKKKFFGPYPVFA